MKFSKRFSILNCVQFLCLIGLVHGQQRDSYTDVAAISTIGQVGDQQGEHSFSQDQNPSDAYGVPSQPQPFYGSTGQDSFGGSFGGSYGGWGQPEMKGWEMPTEAPKGWAMPTKASKGWGMPKTKKPKASKGWGKPEMKGWGQPEMKGWGMPTEAPKGWGMPEGPSYKYKYKIIPHKEEEHEGWGWPEEEEKGKKKGLYGLFGLFGLMGILPWIFVLLIAGLLFIPIPIIPNPGRALDNLLTVGRSTLFNSTALSNLDMDSMQNILKAISKDYSSVYKNTECIERWSCSLMEWAQKYSPDSATDKVSKLLNTSDNNFMKRVKQGVAGAGKQCQNFKCDLTAPKKKKEKVKS